MNLSGILGLVIAACTIIGVMLLGPTDTFPIPYFINIPSIAFVLALACGLELMAASARDVGRALWSIRVLIVDLSPDRVSLRDASILRDLAVRLHLAGVIGTLIGLVEILACINVVSHLGLSLAFALLTIFTAFIVAEVILRPAAQRISFLLETPSP
jgi:flagellar motor component MotA